MKINSQTGLMVVVIAIAMIPVGVVAASHVMFSHYSVLTGEGCSAYSIAMLREEEKVDNKTPPVPTPKVECKCGGTKQVRSGDGIMVIPCPCSNCTCKKGSLPVCNCKGVVPCQCSKCACPKTATRTASVPAARKKVFLVTAKDWCLPCKQVDLNTLPALRTMGWKIHEFNGTISKDSHIEVVDADQYRQMANRFGIHSFPTWVLVRDGNIVNRYSGTFNGYGVGKFFDEQAVPAEDTRIIPLK